MENEVNIADIKTIVNRILDHIHDNLRINSIKIESSKDYYWDIDADIRYNKVGPEPRPSIGRISDDVEFLRPLLSDQSQSVASMLMHVAPLLRFVGESVVR